MQKKVYVLLFVLEVTIIFLAAIFQKSTGYMDADYYYANAVNIANGKGLNESFLWNYLDDPTGIPHSSFTYWMPLASLVSSVALFLAGNSSFSVSRIPFFLLSGFLPILVAHVTLRLSGDRKAAWMAALFSIFSGFYLIYIGLPETFLLYMFLGACFFEIGMTLFEKTNRFKPIYLALCGGLGAITGLMVLTRADGFLWLAAGVGLLIFATPGWGKARKYLDGLLAILCLMAGFALVTFAWYYRNIVVFGSWMAPGGIKTLWLTEYNETFIYPASLLTYTHWSSVGLVSHLKDYLSALLVNIQTLLIVQGEIFLVPFVAIAFVRNKNLRILKYFAFLYIVQFAFSTFIFPFSGARGGYFHSGSAFQIVLWALAGVGFWQFLEWGVAKRGWQIVRSAKLFVPAAVFLALLLTGFTYWQKVIGKDPTNPIWNQDHLKYQAVENQLIAKGFSPDQSILINNPPGYFLVSGRPAYVIPDGDTSTLVQVARKYNIGVLAIDQNHPEGLNPFYAESKSQGGFTFLFDVENYEIYSFQAK